MAEPCEAMLDIGGVADFAHFAIVDHINPRCDLLANRCLDGHRFIFDISSASVSHVGGRSHLPAHAGLMGVIFRAQEMQGNVWLLPDHPAIMAWRNRKQITRC